MFCLKFKSIHCFWDFLKVIVFIVVKYNVTLIRNMYLVLSSVWLRYLKRYKHCSSWIQLCWVKYLSIWNSWLEIWYILYFWFRLLCTCTSVKIGHIIFIDLYKQPLESYELNPKLTLSSNFVLLHLRLLLFSDYPLQPVEVEPGQSAHLNILTRLYIDGLTNFHVLILASFTKNDNR